MSYDNKSKHRQILHSGLFLGIGFCALSLSACQQPDNHNTTTDQADNISQTNSTEDTTAANSAQVSTKTQFPHYIDKLPTLLHPITPFITSENDGIYDELSSSKSRDNNYYPSIFSENTPYTYNSHMSNLVFENIATGTTKTLLPNNDFLIQQMFIPFVSSSPISQQDQSDAVTVAPSQATNENELAQNVPTTEAQRESADVETVTTLFGRMIYHINETPYQENDDDQNLFSQQALYMSDDMGGALNKLHPDNEFVQQTKWMPQISRYYFITQSDSDDNGNINEQDKTYNYQIDFSTDEPTVKKYDFTDESL